MKHFFNIFKIFVIILFSLFVNVNFSDISAANVVKKPVAPSNIDLKNWYAGRTSSILYQPTKNSISEVSNTENKMNINSISFTDFLKQKGYYKNESSDEALNMRNATLRFQSSCNLVADGIYGPKTEAAFKKSLEGFKYNDTVKNAPLQNYWITINKTNKVLTLYDGTNVVKKYPVATGVDPSYTPEGKFSVVIKVVDPYWNDGTSSAAGGSPDNPLGHRWMGLSIGGGSAYGIHGNNSPYSIGTYASHGCIRMINSDVEQLYDNIATGTPVWIGTNSELASWGINQSALQ